MTLIKLSLEQKTEHNKWIDRFQKEYGFRFYNPTYESVPFTSVLFDDERVKKRVSKIEQFLIGTYPIYMGTNNHKEMHKIRYSFSEEEYKWHQKHNKLSVNCLSSVAGTGTMIISEILDRNDLQVINSFPDWNNMSFDEKLEYSTHIDMKLFNILKRLKEDYQRQS